VDWSFSSRRAISFGLTIETKIKNRVDASGGRNLEMLSSLPVIFCDFQYLWIIITRSFFFLNVKILIVKLILSSSISRYKSEMKWYEMKWNLQKNNEENKQKKEIMLFTWERERKEMKRRTSFDKNVLHLERLKLRGASWLSWKKMDHN